MRTPRRKFFDLRLARILRPTAMIFGMLTATGGRSIGDELSAHIYLMSDDSTVDSNSRRALTARVDSLTDKKVLSLSAWGEECLFQIETSVGDIFYLKPDGNLEWEIILNSKPEESRICFPFQSRGLTLHYQSELSALEIAEGAFRPDSVVGSYAVCHFFGRNNRRTLKSESSCPLSYGSGKAFHIYAPYARDNNGLTVKVDLQIDTLQNRFCLMLPRNFIDQAAYPIVIDPQFGKTDIGASTMNMSTGNSGGGLYGVPQDGTVDSISVYIDEDGTAGTVGGAVYLDDGGCATLLDSTLQTYNTTANQDGWFQMPAAENGNLADGQYYWIMAFTGGSALLFHYDTRSGAAAIRDYDDPWPSDNPCSSPSWSYTDRDLSMYVTYTVAAERETGRRRRFIPVQ